MHSDNIIEILKLINPKTNYNFKIPVNEIRLNIILNKQSIKHFFALTDSHSPNKELHQKISINKIINDPQNIFEKKIFNRTTKEHIKTITEKIDSFINFYEKIENKDIDDINVFYDVKFKTYNGHWLFQFMNNIVVLQQFPKYNKTNNHIFFNCCLYSFRYKKKCLHTKPYEIKINKITWVKKD